MTNNIALDVFIGLTFIYLLYSLLATIFLEFCAQVLDLRANNLIDAIKVMLEDREEKNGNLFQRWLANFTIWINSFSKHFPKESLAKALYKHPTIKYLSQSSWNNKPSYIGPSNFSKTILRILKGTDYNGSEPPMNAIYRTLFEHKSIKVGTGVNAITTAIEPETLDHIKQLYIESKKDADRFEALLENWFDETMERATGWYKKKTQWITFFIGLTLAIAFNVDTIAIYSILAKDEKAREQMVTLAIQASPKYEQMVSNMRTSETKVNPPIEFPQRAASSNPLDTAAKKDTNRVVDSVAATTDLPDNSHKSNEEYKQAYELISSDIKNATSVLGLGRTWEDTCPTCDAYLQSVRASSISENLKQNILRYLSTKKGREELCGDDCATKQKWLQWHPKQTGGFVTILGWIITALAISLGAPFWFDLLNKVIQLRTSVAKPKDADTGGGSSKLDDKTTPGSSPTKRVG